MSSRRWLATNLVANSMLGVLGLLSSSLAGWTLGTEGRGRLAALQVTSAMVALLASIGLPDAVVYFLSRHPTNSPRIIGTATRMVSYMSVAVTLVAIAPVMFLLGRYDTATRNAGLLLLAAAPIIALTNVWHQSLRGLQRSTAWNGVRILGASIWVLAIVGAAVGGKRAPIAAIWYVALLIPMLLATRFVVLRTISERVVNDTSLRRPLLHFAVPSVAASIPLYLNLRLDQVVLTRLATPKDLGLYAAATGFTWAVNPPLQAIASLTFPTVASITDVSRQRRQMLRITRLATPVCLVTALLVAGLTPIALPLLNGPSFRPAVHVALILVVASSIFAYEYILEEAARGLGLPRLAVIGQLTGLVSTVVGLFLLIPKFGIVGAAWASVMGYGVACGTDIALLMRNLRCSIAELLIPSRTDIRQAWTALRRR